MNDLIKTYLPLSVLLTIIIIPLIGWIVNLSELISTLGDGTITTMFIARAVGVVVAPLGAILGYF